MMKGYLRTVAGKFTLFVIITLCLAMLLGCFAGIYVIVETQMYFRQETEILDGHVEGHVSNLALNYVLDYYYKRESIDIPDGISIAIRDTDGKLIHATDRTVDNPPDENTIVYSYSATISHKDDGRYSVIWNESIPDGENEVCNIDVYYRVGTLFHTGDYILFQLYHILYSLRFLIYPISILLIILLIGAFVALMTVSGHRKGTDEILPGTLMIIPFDAMLAAYVIFVIYAAFVCFRVIDNYFSLYGIIIIVTCIIVFELFLGLCMSLATRMKLHRLIKGSLIYMILRLVWKIIRWFVRLIGRIFRALGRFFRMFPVVWRTIIILTVLAVAEILVIACCWYETDNLLIWWFFEKLTLYPLIIWGAFSFRKLQNAGKRMAMGDLTYKTNIKSLYRGFRLHGENLNSISDAMSVAVEDRLKSERMKTELITNVSHDIKTPLTSIINYSSLIESEECDNPKIKEYSSVLTRQSEKLKRLIEDLVEASKASTGSIDIVSEPCDPGMFISQASGEYEDKMNAAGLTLITQHPEKEVRIMADTRRMWRVFDNLMNNVCKYSQNGTRVYLSLEESGKNAVITLKNTSREPLNISADELMERFVRGDSSRNTDGNGLGLSIAKSLTELQGGKMNLNIDGDLFKVTLIFPII